MNDSVYPKPCDDANQMIPIIDVNNLEGEIKRQSMHAVLFLRMGGMPPNSPIHGGID